MGVCASGPDDVEVVDGFDGPAATDEEDGDHEKTKGGSLIIHRRMSAQKQEKYLAEEAVIDTTKGGSMLLNQKVLQYA